MAASEIAWQVVKMVIALILVGGAAYYGSRWIGGMYTKSWASRRLRLVEAVGLGPGKMVCLVRVNGKELLLGVTAHSISLLQTLEAVEAGDGEDNDAGPPGFTDVFLNLLGRKHLDQHERDRIQPRIDDQEESGGQNEL